MSSAGPLTSNFEFPSQDGKVNARQHLTVKAGWIKNPSGLVL
jgi:hypothetical protein